VPVPAGVSNLTVNVLIETTAGSRAGRGGPANVE
jgi:hypothetical protein